MLQGLKRFIRDEAGTSAIEYGFILTLLTIGIIGSVISMGNSVSTFLNNALAGLVR